MEPNKTLQKGRGNRGVAVSFKNVTVSSSKANSELLSVASSKSSRQNKERARKVLQEFTSRVGTKDPQKVTPQTSILILNLLSKYCKTGSALSEDTMGGLIQGLRYLLEDFGLRGPWIPDKITGNVSGSLLTANDDIRQLS